MNYPYRAPVPFESVHRRNAESLRVTLETAKEVSRLLCTLPSQWPDGLKSHMRTCRLLHQIPTNMNDEAQFIADWLLEERKKESLEE